MQFIVPAQPKLRASPPVGEGWIHEVKFDGWRIQMHKDGALVRLYTKNGYDCTKRFDGLASALAAVPARSCIIDGEVTAFDPLGLIDFNALHFRSAADIAVWAFDLLFHNGRDVRKLPLIERKDLRWSWSWGPATNGSASPMVSTMESSSWPLPSGWGSKA